MLKSVKVVKLMISFVMIVNGFWWFFVVLFVKMIGRIGSMYGEMVVMNLVVRLILIRMSICGLE